MTTSAKIQAQLLGLCFLILFGCNAKELIRNLRSSGDDTDVVKKNPTSATIDGIVYEIEASLIKKDFDVESKDIFNFSSKGLIGISGEEVFLVGENGKVLVDFLPDFFGSKDQLFVRMPVLSDDSQVSAWYFYQDDIEPKFAQALPAYVHSKNINERPDLQSEDWKMLDKDSFESLFASEKQIWLRDKSELVTIKRDVSEFTIAKAALSEGLKFIGGSLTEITFVSKDGIVFIYELIEQKFSVVKKALPKGISAEDSFVVLPYGKVDVLVTADGSLFISARSHANWFSIGSLEGESKTLDASFIKAQAFGDLATLYFNNLLVKIELKHEKAKNKSNKPTLDPDLLKVFQLSCGASSCHSSAAVDGSLEDPSKFPNEYPNAASRFDYHSMDHWYYFVTKRGRREAKDFILDNMCARNPTASVCVNPTSHVDQRKKITTFIDEIEIK